MQAKLPVYDHGLSEADSKLNRCKNFLDESAESEIERLEVSGANVSVIPLEALDPAEERKRKLPAHLNTVEGTNGENIPEMLSILTLSVKARDSKPWSMKRSSCQKFSK
ncbi:unnamed protein product [Lepeophtheirus salmonis]|uniref:(salmon louse) hypothetical protein n=1 Tax=Lepeophtheirus salmonis TaxID=72036 RepID=A0A817FGU9_LEPSM|nr:unnamed protein product [Lepeophtheirus salmonis]CAG9478140.1 unnamed protein product [Lepeophtheirus salmonis]